MRAGRAKVRVQKKMAFHAAVDELFRSYRCQSVYLDVGTNIGVQIRKLYEPEKYPNAPALRIFDDVFGINRCGVCTVGVEPNPHHAVRLADLQRRYRAVGIPVLVLHAAASDAESVTKLALEDRNAVDTAEDGGATTVASWRGARASSSISVVEVATIDLSDLIYRVHRHLQELHGRTRGSSRLLMKLDVEGSEYRILPHLVLTQTLCLVDRAFLEWHPDNYAPKAAAVSAAQRYLTKREAGVEAVSTMLHAIKGAIHEILDRGTKADDCRLQYTFLDDEEYLWDGKPWPNATLCTAAAGGPRTRRRSGGTRGRGGRHGGGGGGGRHVASQSHTTTLRAARPGYCDTTIDWEGDCTLGYSGSWRARHHNITTVRACAAHCRKHCARCNFVSFKRGHMAECSWFHGCQSPLRMEFGGDQWQTISVQRDD